MKLIKFTAIALLMLCAADQAFSQKIKFGKVTMKDMEMEVYEQDSSAVAVVLSDIGAFRSGDYTFHRHVRIKILKQAGTSYGNFTIRTPSRGNFRAYTHNLENGEIVSEKFKKSEVHEEEIADDLLVYKVFLPNVKVGSIVELEYSHQWIPYEWRFQDMIPVRYSELLVERTTYVEFDMNHFGHINKQRIGSNHWIARNVPAFKPEPYMDSYNNYIGKIEFEMTLISIPGVFYKEYSTTWEKVSKILFEHEFFGTIYKTSSIYLKETAKELKNLELTPIEKINLAYDFIQENQKWNGRHSLYATRDYRANFKTNHEGNSAEINLNLVSLLRKMDIDAYPVVLSTKDNGVLKKYKATISKLNHVVVLAMIGNEEILMDATAKFLRPGVLPIECLNGDGWVVDEYSGRWVEMKPSTPSLETSFAQIESQEDGTWIAKTKSNQTVYMYYDWKNGFDEFQSSEKYQQYLDDEFDDISLNEYAVDDNDSLMKSSETMTLDITSNMVDLGNEVILNPFVFSLGLENPFKSEERLTPVDLEYQKAVTRTIMLKIPGNLQIKKVPEPITIETENKEAIFSFYPQVSNQMIVIKYNLIIQNPIIPVEQYPIFKTFYSLMIDKLNESITFSKT